MRVVSLFVFVLAMSGCGGNEEAPANGGAAETESAETAAGRSANRGEINPRLLRRFKPVVGQGGSAQLSEEKVALGRMLWFDKRLSRGNELSCNSCHDLSNFGVDGRTFSIGHEGAVGQRNAPTVYNAASHIAQFWDGRADTIEAQAKGPLLNPLEMANTEEKLIATLSSIPLYVELFRAAFPGQPEPITLATISAALGAFERGLSTESRWDEFIGGKANALTAVEKRGLRVFLDVGCMACHTGPQVGASMYQRVGVIEPWPNQKDLGRGEITKSAADRMIFKVPSLKNIAETGPYFHDGSAKTLEEAIGIMARHQVGVELSDLDIHAIATWMHSLTGTIDPAYVAAPELPPSSDRTPTQLSSK